MFSLGTIHTQVYPIGHVASVLNGVRNTILSSSNIKKKLKNKQVEGPAAIVCYKSFKRAVDNCTELNLKELSLVDLNTVLPLPSSSSDWNTSHISSNSFFENKNGFSEDELSLTSYPIHYRYFQAKHAFTTPSSNGLFQKRSFKTIRSKTYESSTSNVYDKLFGIGKRDTKLSKETKQNEKLKTLLHDEGIGVEEQQKLKVAFAEGYVAADPKSKPSSRMRFFNLFRDGLGIVLIIAVLVSLIGGPFRKVLIATTNEVHPEDIEVTFDDVKGVDEAKDELMEVVQFLKNPEKFSALGAKLPKGVLLVGPPGTGKTLLARAVAGEANVPFFHAAGPEFDEILVGQGARRVRDLFNTAKMRAPCVVFIDEIDSVGAKRSNSVLHPYANQTINQLLSEMDGFKKNEGVIVLGATNRREDLDKALLRPGRFDVEVIVPVPDFQGRVEILQLYLGKVKTAPDVSVEKLARGITGFTGADIENLVNQAALKASSDGAFAVTMEYLDWARDKILMGPERKARIADEEANKITAYHEGGHALVSMYTKYMSPVYKVTIIPRGPSLGHTAYIPEKENYHVNKAEMLATLDTLMGGRAAEELIFGTDKVTSGAADDLRKATALATSMVKEWGMSDKVGLRSFHEDRSSLVNVNELGQTMSELIDSEIKQILSDSYERAKNILKAHKREHKLLAEALLKYETLNSEDLKNIVGEIKE